MQSSVWPALAQALGISKTCLIRLPTTAITTSLRMGPGSTALPMSQIHATTTALVMDAITITQQALIQAT